jgi:hypothetical protein
MSNPNNEHFNALNRIWKYLLRYPELGLIYDCNGNDLFIKGYSDSDRGNDLDQRRSTSGYIFSLSGDIGINNPISWNSQLQKTIALSSCEAEHMVLKEAIKEAGDDANIAKIFCSRGIQKVLAMSFKVSSSAASIFLQHFYQDRLVICRTFSSSASRARATLRASCERGARFGLKLPLKDWFVLVVYSSVLVSTSVRAESSGTLRPSMYL